MSIERRSFDEYSEKCLYHPTRGCMHLSDAPTAKFIGSVTKSNDPWKNPFAPQLHAPTLDIDFPTTIKILNRTARRLKITGPKPKGKFVNALLAAMVSCGLMKREEELKTRVVPEREDQCDPLPALILKVSARLHPSSTAGHFHLYMQREMTWEKYEKLLNALRDAEVIGQDFHAMCIRWRCSFLLKPEFTKSDLNIKFKKS